MFFICNGMGTRPLLWHTVRMEKKWAGVFVVCAVFFLGVVFGNLGILSVPGVRGAEGSAAEDLDLTPLFEAHRLLEAHFQSASSTAPTVSTEERVWGAVQGLTASYGDPYTVFLPPKEKEIFESSVRGDFQGVGMEIGIRDDILTVVAPLKDTPAYRAGIKSGDIILSIDGTSTAGMSVEEAVSIIRGEKGTAVVLTLVRGEGQPFDVSVVRDVILLPTIETELNDGVFIIRLFNFNALAPQYFRDAVRAFAESGTTKLIIDLRGNPGGFLEVAVDLASWFLPVGKAIVIEDYNDDSHDKTLRSRGYDVFTDELKLVILINGGSASASEIFAGALRAYGKATLIGETSFGKGSVQQVFDVTPDASLKITIARWLTPNGESISDGGIVPDIEVVPSPEDSEHSRDIQLERAIEFLQSR